ncbi:Protein of unknown function, partial [Gryllus bimaculatus]
CNIGFTRAPLDSRDVGITFKQLVTVDESTELRIKSLQAAEPLVCLPPQSQPQRSHGVRRPQEADQQGQPVCHRKDGPCID